MDNSPDDSLRNVIVVDDRVKYMHIENRGYGNAHNQAIRMALESGADYHLVLNPDVRWDGQILAKLVADMEADDSCGMMQPRLTYPDGRLQHACRLLPTPFDVFAKRFLPGRLIAGRMRRYLLADSAYDRTFNAVYMQGSFMLFSAKALRDVGCFDERFFMYPEDIDITRRMRRRYSAMYNPTVTVVHDHAATSSRFNRLLWIHITNMIRYFNKWGWFVDKERRRLNRQLLDELRARSCQ